MQHFLCLQSKLKTINIDRIWQVVLSFDMQLKISTQFEVAIYLKL